MYVCHVCVATCMYVVQVVVACSCRVVVVVSSHVLVQVLVLYMCTCTIVSCNTVKNCNCHECSAELGNCVHVLQVVVVVLLYSTYMYFLGYPLRILHVYCIFKQ